ncbi:MAG: hypothetical protein K1X49_08970 [Saprospiraceae bacterium]|jgi:Ca2+:H+ antiporter|nr:hypothetical protein [Saprospiraceae bacterium]
MQIGIRQIKLERKHILKFIIPILSWILLLFGELDNNLFFQLCGGLFLILSVIAAVLHSETIAHRLGEPFGTIILAVAITTIEVSLIVSLMLSGDASTVYLARDTVFSAVMIILNGIIGLSLFIGGWKYYEQNFSKYSSTIALVSLVSIIVLSLVFPSYTTSAPGPFYNLAQLIFVAIACMVIYSFFLFAQTRWYKQYFIVAQEIHEERNVVSIQSFITAFISLFLCLAAVVLLAKKLSPCIESLVVDSNLPRAMVGVIIAFIILLPEGTAAVMAAVKNNLQTSLNLALGSALASIGLTIPSVALVCAYTGMNIALGLDPKSIILLSLSVFIVFMSLISGKSNIVYGVVLLVNFLAYIFLIIHP